MLETTLATRFEPGSNLKGEATGASWFYLLPDLEVGTIVCAGVPPPRTLAALARRSRQVAVVCASRGAARRVGAWCRRGRHTGVEVSLPGGDGGWLLADDWAQLALVLGRWRGMRGWTAAAGHRWWAELRRVLAPAGVVYLETFERPGGRSGEDAVGRRLAAAGLARPVRFWLTPLRGEMQTAVPLERPGVQRDLLRRGLHAPTVRVRGLRRLSARIDRKLATGRLGRRIGYLAGGISGGGEVCGEPRSRLPRYLRQIAAAAGVSLDELDWGFSAPGTYRSRKLLFLAYEPGGALRYVVKMVRDPELGPRLENERRALIRLAELGVGGSGSVPRVVFAGEACGRVLVGESAIEGEPLRRRSRGAADCPWGRRAIDWLIELGAHTVGRGSAPPAEVAAVMRQLLERFVDIYRPAAALRDALAGQIETVEGCAESLPLVFQHGDPGMWNVLVSRRGGIALLDWEAAEPQGVPLWDLFYFLRSYCIWEARCRGERRALAALERTLLRPTPLHRLLCEKVGEYRRRVGVPVGLIEPLFHTCWMHRALKEATRLPPRRLARGHYVQLLRLGVELRQRPALQELLAPDACAPRGAASPEQAR